MLQNCFFNKYTQRSVNETASAVRVSMRASDAVNINSFSQTNTMACHLMCPSHLPWRDSVCTHVWAHAHVDGFMWWFYFYRCVDHGLELAEESEVVSDSGLEWAKYMISLHECFILMSIGRLCSMKNFSLCHVDSWNAWMDSAIYFMYFNVFQYRNITYSMWCYAIV